MKNYILVDKDKIESCKLTLRPNLLDILYFSPDKITLKSLLQQAFDDSRTIKSEVISKSVQHKYENFEDWYNKQQEQ